MLLGTVFFVPLVVGVPLLFAWFMNPASCASARGYALRCRIIWTYLVLVPTLLVFVWSVSLNPFSPWGGIRDWRTELFALFPIPLLSIVMSVVFALRAFGERARFKRAAILFRANNSRCPVCEYDFPDARQPRCPECGWEPTRGVPRLRISDGHIPLVVALFAQLSAALLGFVLRAWGRLELFENWFVALVAVDLMLLLILLVEVAVIGAPLLRQRQPRFRRSKTGSGAEAVGGPEAVDSE